MTEALRMARGRVAAAGTGLRLATSASPTAPG